MAEDMLYQLLAAVPPKATRAIVIFPDPTTGRWQCRWTGVDPPDVAEALYQCADQVIDERVVAPRPLRRGV